MKTFIIGDIHGCYDELIELIDKAKIKEEDFVLSVGDIVDRGPKSKEVYHFFKNRPLSKVIMGNHERKHLNGVLSYAQEIVKIQMGQEYEDFVKWIGNLDYSFEAADFMVVHAAYEHDKKMKEQREEVLSGTTSGDRYLSKKYAPDTYWNEYYTGNKAIFYGHHVVGNEVKKINNTFGIDTGACHGGYLTAVEMPGFFIHQVKIKKDYWEEEQAKWQIDVLKAKPWLTMPFDQIKKNLDKLHYLVDPEVVAYLQEIRTIILKTETLFDVIKNELDKITKEILKSNENNFSAIANQYNFSRYLFLSKSNKLSVQELRKNYDTPQKVLDLCELLNIPH